MLKIQNHSEILFKIFYKFNYFCLHITKKPNCLLFYTFTLSDFDVVSVYNDNVRH